ncbi:MAG: hypothetical protein OXE75_02055, partial [bacterium]|nr:hypothetical protein [bacterium]
MHSAARTLSGLGLAAALGLPAAVTAQQLWNIEEVAAQPGPPILMDGVAVSAAAAGAPTAEAATVQVAFDYLRLGMGYLEFPLPDGSMIAAENAVFEDRGDGNLMWTGEVPGAGYESVVLTVQDGHLVGWFGEPGGPKYVVYAGPDGRGSLAEEVGPTGDWCGAGEGAGRDLVRDAAAASHRPTAVASPSSDDRLDILVIYPEETEHYWRVIGGPAVGVRQLGDYLNMAFRNGEILTTANLIPVRWDPKLAHHPTTSGWHYEKPFSASSSVAARQWQWEFRSSAAVDVLRTRHRPDLVHFIPDLGGAAGLRMDLDPEVYYGYSVPSPSVFAHEIGHNLGGDHEPVTFGDRFQKVQSEAFRPYMFGHTDLTSCAKREGYYDALFCPRTIMSYGQDLWDDPNRFATEEPFYSSVRHKPNGWTIGVSGTSEVERVFHETVPVASVSGEAPWRAEQYPRRVTVVRWTGHDTVRVDWSEDWRSQHSGSVDLALAEGANDSYRWVWDWEGNSNGPPRHEKYSDPNVTPIVRAGGVQVGVEISGLRPGGGYRMAVRGPYYRWVAEGEPLIESLASDVFVLKPRGRASGAPAAASQVGARVTGSDSVRLHWRDNSGFEDGYEVWYRKWSGEEPDEAWSRYGDPLPARTRHVEVGLAAEEEIQVTDGYYDSEKRVLVEGARAMRGRYSFVVVAYNDKGWNASETFDLEFMPGPHLEPTTAGEVTDCITWSRPTGIDLDGYQVDACLETPDGARRRAWDYQLDADQSGLL